VPHEVAAARAVEQVEDGSSAVGIDDGDLRPAGHGVQHPGDQPCFDGIDAAGDEIGA